MKLYIVTITRLFPLWALLFSLLAWSQPALFSGFKVMIMPLLSLVMLGMGLGLHMSDFSRALNMPRLIVLGIALQYGIMPVAALGISMLLKLDPVLTAGMVLVGASPGGTASNVICYLARGNVALSITLTAISTLLSVILTPLLALLLIDVHITVPAGDMLLRIAYMVLAPVCVGLILNHFFGARLKSVRHVFPLISVIAIVLIIAIIVALNSADLAQVGWLMLLAVMLHNAVGLGGGYLISRLMGFPERECRTLAIEVGMQNSGLAVALAVKYFPVAAALPGAFFSIWHNLTGSLLAAFWSRTNPGQKAVNK
jgi:BASS family bile acid:Na+ symporter